MTLKYTKKGKKGDRGATLTEMLLAVIVIGILTAVTAPSLIGLFNQNRVRDGFTQVKGAIKESQRLARRRGKHCRIHIDEANQEVDISPPRGRNNYTGCLLSERKLPDGVVVKTNYRSPNITFSAKGNTSSAGTIVVYSPTTHTKKCLVISLGLGIMRSGNYTGDMSNSVSGRNCQTTDS